MKRGEPYHTSVGRFMKLPETFEENLSTISFTGAEVERNEYRGGLWGEENGKAMIDQGEVPSTQNNNRRNFGQRSGAWAKKMDLVNISFV